MIKLATITTTVVPTTSWRVGKDTLFHSDRTSLRNSLTLLNQFIDNDPRRKVAGQEGFEPPTLGFGDRCSTVGATGLSKVVKVESLEPAPSTGAGLLQDLRHRA